MGIVYYHHYQPKEESDISDIKQNMESVNFTVSCKPFEFNYAKDDHYADSLFLGKDESSAFYVGNVGYERSWFERVVHGKRNDQYIIHFVFEGVGAFNSMPVSRGQAFVCLPNEKYSLVNDPKAPLRYGWISVNGNALEDQIRLLALPTSSVINIRDIDAVERILKNTVYNKEDGIPFGNMQSLLLSRLFEVLSLLDIDNLARQTENSAHIRYIEAVKEYINTHYQYNIAVTDMARYAGVSVSYLRQIFATHLGMSPQEAMIQKRMSVAKKLLAQTSMSVSEVASECGYSDQSAFCKVFKKTQAISALQYRKQSKNGEAKTS